MKKQYADVSVPSKKPTFCIGIKDVESTPRGKQLLKKDAALSVLSEMLFSRTAPLYNSLLEDGLISPDFSMGTSLGDGFCFVSVMGEADDPQKVYEKFKEYIASVAEKGLSKKDFLRNRRILYADFVTAFDTTEDIANTMMNYAVDGLSPFDFIDTVKTMTFDDIKCVFDSMLKEENYALAVALPTAQKEGQEFSARTVWAGEDGLTLTLEGAYPKEAGLLSYEREGRLTAHGVTVTDRVKFAAPSKADFCFLVAEKPTLDGDVLRFPSGREMTLPLGVSATVEEIPLSSYMQRSWHRPLLWRVVATAEDVLEGTFAFTVR
jgi:hypothetical protein